MKSVSAQDFNKESLYYIADTLGIPVNVQDGYIMGHGEVSTLRFPCGWEFDKPKIEIFDSILLFNLVGVYVSIDQMFYVVILSERKYHRTVMYYVDPDKLSGDGNKISVFSSRWSRLNFYVRVEKAVCGLYVFDHKNGSMWENFDNEIEKITKYLDIRQFGYEKQGVEYKYVESGMAVKEAGLTFLTG